MTRIFLPPDDQKKKRIAVRMPKEMHKSILQCLMEKGLSARSISSWVSESILDLMRDNSYCEIIAEEWLDKGDCLSRPLTISSQAYNALEKINAMVRCKLHMGPDINSKIIRASITQRLIREEHSSMTM
jgi:hypothetical protein